MSRKRIRKLRLKLWEKLDGRCENCGVKTDLPRLDKAIGSHAQPDTMATIDHKYCRNHPERLLPTDGRTRRLFLYCKKCNREKAIIENLWVKLYPKIKLIEYERRGN